MSTPQHHDGRPFSLFEYSSPVLPLDGSHIRILRLRSPRGDTPELRYASPLSCSLTHTPIASPSPFKALSYTWGTGDRTHWIDIAGSALTITASLDTALRHIRSDDQDVFIWIDQICINQEDAVEKTSQVQVMKEIYSKAEQVIVWLGPSADGSDELMDCWQDIGQAARDLDIESYYTKERLPVLQGMLRNPNPDDETAQQFKALLDRAGPVFEPLYHAMIAWNKRSWFHRVWTIQEVGLCPDAVFQCGSKIVAVELISLACHIFDSSITRFGEDIPDKETLELLSAAQDRNSVPILSSRRRRQNFNQGTGTGDELFNLMRKFFVGCGPGVTHSRDRIIGLLGLAVDSDSLGIVPDYTDADPRPTFITAARAMIQSGRLELLSYAQFPKEEALEGLPTWVPDWRPMLAQSFYHIHEPAEDHLFAASGQSTVALVPTEATDVLGIRGYIVDTIDEVAATWTSFNDYGEVLRNMQDGKRLFELALAKDDPIYDNPRRRAEALWRLPIGDMYLTAEQRGCRPPSDVETHYNRNLDVLKIVLEYPTAGPEEQMANLAKMRHFEKTASLYRNGVSNMWGKKPFVTQKGFLGMCPDTAGVGDVVVVFCGSRIPHVLRPIQGGERFSFVGEAYCDGIMDGEIVPRRTETSFWVV